MDCPGMYGVRRGIARGEVAVTHGVDENRRRGRGDEAGDGQLH